MRRYLAAGGWTPYRTPERAAALDGLGEWLAERFRRHRGNADVVRQDLARERGVAGEPAHRRARGGAAAAGAGGGGAGDGALRDAARPPDAGGLRRIAGAGRGRDGTGVPVRRHARAFAAPLRARVPARAAVGVAGRHRGRVPPLRRGRRGGAGGQRQGAGPAPRRGDARGAVQRPLPRLRGLLGLPAARLRAVPGPDQRQGREGRRLRQAQRHRRSPLRLLGGDGGASGALDARGRRRARPRHHGRAADRAVRARRGGGAAPAWRPPALPAGPRAGAGGAVGRLRRVGHQPLQRALAADRRGGDGAGRRRARSSHRTPGPRWRGTANGAAAGSASVLAEHLEGIVGAALAASRPAGRRAAAAAGAAAAAWPSTSGCWEGPGDGRGGGGRAWRRCWRG